MTASPPYGWWVLYNALQWAALPLFAAPALVYLMSRSRYRHQLPARLGRLPDLRTLRGRSPILWIHALSVGEVNAANPLARALAERFPAAGIVCSASTATGLSALTGRLGAVAHVITALPFDLHPIVRRVIARLAPDCFILVETDVWPNLLWALAASGVPSVLVNGGISSHSARRLGRVRALSRAVYDTFSVLAMQSADDRARVLDLGVLPAKVHAPGNLKYDIRVPPMDPEAARGLRVDLGLPPDGPLWVAGSTHPGEEEEVLAAHIAARSKVPGLQLLIAPRYPARAPEILKMAARLGLSASLRTRAAHSSNDRTGRPEVVILDTLGELLRCYALGCLAFVGGSLVPVGGHNLFEPAAYGRPVLFGPETESCREMAEALTAGGGGMQVEKGGLADAVEALLMDPSALGRMGRNAEALAASNRGAVGRHVDLIAEVLDGRGVRRG